MKKLIIAALSLVVINYTATAQKKLTTKPVKSPKTITTASGLQYTITLESNGPKPNVGDKIIAHYTGKLTNDTVFDSSYKRGTPFTTRIGVGQVIKGWDEAFLLLKKGEKATLRIPSEIGYGDRDMGSIPPNSVLIFDVELIDIIPSAKPYDIKGKDSIVTANGVKIYTIQANPQGVLPIDGDLVSIHYTGYFTDGKMFDSSLDRGEPMPFALGGKNVITGLDEAVRKIRKGEKARVIIPYMLAYGEAGYSGVIPPKADLIFDIEMVDVKPKPSTKPYDIKGKEIKSTASGLKYIIVSKGAGKKAVAGNSCSVHYTGFLEDGTKFDSSVDRGQPFQFSLGAGQVIKGWDEGVALMNVGDKYHFIIPYELGYGEEGYPPTIPAKATLVFDVELMDAK